MQVYRRLQPIVANAWTVLDRAEQDLQDAARLADPPGSLETQWRRGRLTGIPDDVVPAARLPARWPPGEGDWPAEQPPTPSPSGTSTGGAPDEPGQLSTGLPGRTVWWCRTGTGRPPRAAYRITVSLQVNDGQ